MKIVNDIDGAHIAAAVASRMAAEESLLRTERSPNLFIILASVIFNSVGFAFIAARGGTTSQIMVGAIAGASFSLAAFCFGECRRLHRRLAAALTLMRTNAL